MAGGNQYSEKWTFEECEAFLKEALDISSNIEMDFIGEVAREQKTYHNVYGYIVDKFPQLKDYLTNIKSNCESNCFYNGKKNNIVPSMAIMNLKSNHGWTDRVESKNENNNTNKSIEPIKWIED